MGAGVREIALITNPTSGKGKGATARDIALARFAKAVGARPESFSVLLRLGG